MTVADQSGNVPMDAVFTHEGHPSGQFANNLPVEPQ
jgi:hypothetical protein